MIKLFNQDNRVVLKTFKDNSVDSIVTDPPYELNYMNNSWDNTGIAFDASFWKECLRVLKPGGHLLSFGGSRTYHRMACAVEDAGFEIRDQIMWVYPNGMPKGLNVRKQIEKGNKNSDFAKAWEGWNTALKPGHEPIVVARKPLSERTVSANVLKWGTGALNIDASRVGTTGAIQKYGFEKPANSNSTNYGKEFSYNKKSRKLDKGKYPANIITDGTDTLLNKYFYCVKASQKERNTGCCVQNAVLVIAETIRNDHATVKPIKLMSYLVKLVTPLHGIVLDPFMGSGSTGIAAKQSNFSFIGMELDSNYFRIAMNRIMCF